MRRAAEFAALNAPRHGPRRSLALPLLLLAAPAAADEAVCATGEATIFACHMGTRPGARIAALCADEHATPWHLAYRFGTPGHVELAYPGPGETAAFRHAIISYSGSGGDAVVFAHGAATYALFYVLGHDGQFEGVSVREGEKEVANLSCATGSVDNLTTDFFKAAALPDADGPFDVPEIFFDRAARARR